MPRLIDADGFVEDLKTEAMNLYLDGMKGTPRNYRDLYDIIDRIVEQPTIDAEPVRNGRWEWREDWGAAFQDPPEIYDAGWACSACGTELLPYLQSHFPDIPSYLECASEKKPTLERCPCCGAKMDSDEDADQSC